MTTNDFLARLAEELAADPDSITIRAGHDFAMRAPIEGSHHLIAWTGTQYGAPIAMLRNADTGNPSIEATLRRHGYVIEYPRGTRNCIVRLTGDETPRMFLERLLKIARKRIPHGSILPFEYTTGQTETAHYPAGMPSV